MANSAPSGPHLGIERIYLRDLSFESPQAPSKCSPRNGGRQVELDIRTRSHRLDDERFEVVLTLTLEARSEERTLLVVELQQAGMFRVRGMDETMRRRLLAVTCPTVLFPYARETIDTLVTKGTFPAFMLAPMNFDALFAETERRREAESEGDVATQTELGSSDATSPSASRSGPRNRS